MLLSVVALMVVLLAKSVAPAFAAWQTTGPDAGCREGDMRVLAERVTPELASVNGKRSADEFVCVSVSGQRRVHVYDNRPVTTPI